MLKVEAICIQCGCTFLVRKYQLKTGAGKFCSHSCYMKSKDQTIPIEERFWSKVDIKSDDDCWNFLGFKNSDGYGRIGTSGNKTEGSHRIAFRLSKGGIPKGSVVMHTCDNPSCCNPHHLILGSQNDNIQDMIQKKRFVKYSKIKASKFTEEEIKEIRDKYTGMRGEKIQLSKEYKCSPTTITNILNDWS